MKKESCNRLISLTASSVAQHDTVTFTHDALGRMTFDGMTGQSMTYNSLDLVGNISRDGTTLVNYFYLSDGTKLSALDGSGAGLVYRARQYSPTLRRWMTPDPLSEKYYGVSPYAFCHDNPINRIDPDGRADWELVLKGTLTTAAGAGTFLGGILAIGGSSGLAAGMGILAIISGKTSIGIGISMMTVGLISDPSNKTQEIKEELPTDLKSTLSKSADIILENENNEIENTVSIIFFAKDLFLFKPNSMENVVDYIKAGGDWADRFLFFWDLYDQHDK